MTIEMLASRFNVAAAGTPTLMLFEDMHWADPTTLDVMNAVIDGVPGTPRLVVITHRPEFVSPWYGRGHVTTHSLARLGRRQVTRIIESMMGGRALPAPLLDEIVSKTDGVPLFVEEFTKTLLEAGYLDDDGTRSPARGHQPLLTVPSTLQDSLVARLDRLTGAKHVAQMAAAIGREFSHALLAEVSPLDGGRLETALEELERAELIYRRGATPEAVYTFKHALVQDAAYDSLLKRERERLHARLSAALLTRFPETAVQVPELLAHHYTQAGMWEEALVNWQRAADVALRRSAYHERLAHLDSALRVLRGLPEPGDRRARELELQVARGGTLMATQGYRAIETGDAFARARELAQAESLDNRQRFAALRGLLGVYYSRAQLDSALEVARACLEIGEAMREHGALAHRLVGQTLFMRGELSAARSHLEQALRVNSATHASEVASLTDGGHQLMAPVFLAQVLWVQGSPDQALSLAEHALEEAERRYGAFAVTTNLFFLCWLCGWRGEFDRLSGHAERIRRLASDHEINEWASPGGLLVDWPQLVDTENTEAPTLARKRLDAVRALGGVMTPFKLGLLAQALARETAAEALAVVDEALEMSAQGERWSEAELMRIKGTILESLDAGCAEDCLRESIRIANDQGAQSWALRAATTLAGQLSRRGRSREARATLAPIYRTFGEGFDTADLLNAKRVIDTLQ